MLVIEALCYKPEGLKPDEVNEMNSASNRNEFQKHKNKVPGE
jgi:hypothetical protein